MRKCFIVFVLVFLMSCATTDPSECGFELSDLINGESEDQALTAWQCNHGLDLTLLSFFEDGTGHFENNGERTFFTWQENACNLISYSTALTTGSFSDIFVSRAEGVLDFVNEVGGKTESYHCTLQPSI